MGKKGFMANSFASNVVLAKTGNLLMVYYCVSCLPRRAFAPGVRHTERHKCVLAPVASLLFRFSVLFGF